MNNQKGIAPIIIILILLGIIGGGILVWQNFNTPKEEIEISEKLVEDETADWETYKNEEYGFEFKISPFLINNGYQVADSESAGTFYFQTKPIAPYGAGQYNIDLDQYDTMFTINIYTQEHCQESAGGKCETEEDCLWKGRDECCCIKNGKSVFSTYLTENSKYFAYYNTGPSSGDKWYAMGWDKEEVRVAVDQMLSTFKFLEIEISEKLTENEVNDWQTYRNEEYGFEIKYPQNWKVRKDEEIYFGESKEVITADGKKISIERIGFSIAFYDNISKLWGNKNNLSLEDWIFEFLFPLQEGEIKQTITFGKNNYNGILLKKEKGVGIICLITTIYVKRDNSIYELKGEVPTITSVNFPTEYDYDKVFNQMLSTFRFLE